MEKPRCWLSLSDPNSQCLIQLPSRAEFYHLQAKWNACSTPANLEIAYKLAHRNTVEVFVAGDGHESRLLRPSYQHWPVLLHVFFTKVEGVQLRVEACLQALKSNEWSCFLNSSLDRPPNAACQENSYLKIFQSSWIAMTVLAVITLLLLVSIVSSCVILVRRRRSIVHSKMTANKRGKRRPDLAQIPILPGVLPYKDESDEFCIGCNYNFETSIASDSLSTTPNNNYSDCSQRKQHRTAAAAAVHCSGGGGRYRKYFSKYQRLHQQQLLTTATSTTTSTCMINSCMLESKLTQTSQLSLIESGLGGDWSSSNESTSATNHNHSNPVVISIIDAQS